MGLNNFFSQKYDTCPCNMGRSVVTVLFPTNMVTLESGIDVGQGINVGPGKFIKKNKRWAGNKRRALKFAKKNTY